MQELTQNGSKRNALLSNIFWLYGLQGLNYLIPAAVLPYLVRVLGIEHYGLMALSQSVAQYFVVATDYGFNFSATRAVAKARENPKAVSRIFWTVSAIKAMLTLLGAVALAVLVIWIPRFHSDASVYFAAYITVIGNALFPAWLFQGMERMRSISIITGVAKLAAAISLFVFVRGRNDILIATLLQSLGFLAAGIVGFVIALRSFVHDTYLPRREDLTNTLKEGGHVFLATASITLYTTSNTVMVGLIAGNVQAGLFSMSERLIRAVTGLVTPFLQAAYPHVVRLISESRYLALRFVGRTLRVGVAIGLAIGACVLIFAHPLTILAFGRATIGAVPVLRIISAFPALIVITASMGVLIFMPFRLEKAFGRLLLIVGVVNIALGCALIPFLGAVGAALGMIIMEALQAVGGWYVLRRHGIDVFFGDPSPAGGCTDNAV